MSSAVELGESYVAIEQQRQAQRAGLWVFLATEVLFFGPLFLAYVQGRLYQHAAFVQGSHHTDLLLGSINTAVLLTSSLTMALAIEAAKASMIRHARWLLLGTAILGTAFLAIKGAEYHHDWEEGLVPGLRFTSAEPSAGVELFFWLYFAMTGVHAIHLFIAIGLVLWAAISRVTRKPTSMRLPLIGLYWHFVDIIWVFLYPLLYLLERYR